MSVANPSCMAEALADPEKVKEAKAKLEKAGVKYILSCWIDMLGQPKTKPVPLSDFELLCAGKGPQFAVHSVSFVPELGPADSDQIPVPDLDSLVICPWDKTCAWMFADLWWEDKPYNLCPRSAMKRVVRDCADKGYAVYAGVEPEFIAMRWRDGQPVKAFDDDPMDSGALRPRRQAFGYDAEYSINSMGFLGELIDILEGPRLEPARRGRRGRLLAVRAGLPLHRRAADGRPPGVPAHAAEGGRQEARHVRHLHAQADHRRLALRART